MIQAQHLTKQFDKRGIAGLNDLSFALDKGQILAIMGPNGSGKTTLLKIIAGQIKQDSGTFSTDGPVHFFSSTGSEENLNVQKLLVESVKLDIEEEKKIQLARDLANTFEFTFQLKQNLNELSSGQRQKVFLAKELINRPSLLLLDEPFTHLDPFTRRDILKGLFEYIRTQEMTVLWVTHDLDEAFNFADSIGLMNFGKFEQTGPPELLVQKPRNLFVAKFIGYRNFFSVKKSGLKWQTPWGEKEIQGPNTEDGILIIPDFSWRISEEGLRFKIISRNAGKQSINYGLSYKTTNIHFIRSSQEKLFEIGQEISLLPIWDECLNIPL